MSERIKAKPPPEYNPESFPAYVERFTEDIADLCGRIVGAPVSRFQPLVQAKIVLGLESVRAELRKVCELTTNYTEDVPS